MAQYATKQDSTPVPRLTDEHAKSHVTIGLMVINVIVLLAMIFEGANPVFPSNEVLTRFGGAQGARSLFVQQWRLLTSTYVHFGLIHIATNLWGLWVLGDLAERIFDRWVYLTMYTCCGLAGSLAAAWWNPMTGTVGASGAIFGIAGALISALYLGKLPLSKSEVQSTLKNLLFVVGLNLLIGARSQSISNAAHIGGFATGLTLGAVLSPSLTAPPTKRQIWATIVFVGAVFVLFCVYVLARYSFLA